MIRFIVLCFCLVTLFCSITAEVIKTVPCEGVVDRCTIHEVRVKPCKEAARNAPCKVKRGSQASIEIDFTPNFSSPTLHSQPYWDNGIKDIEMIGMDTDACKTTKCPLDGEKQTYKYGLDISQNYPAATYNVKWKLTGDSEDKLCCFGLKIKIMR